MNTNTSKKNLKKLIVVIPAYNEKNSIEKTIHGLKKISEPLSEMGYQLLIYVVDDGSTDGTGPLARQAGVERLLIHKVNIGLGAAVRTGLLAARNDGADIAIKFDADLQHDPFDILELIKPICHDEAEIVYGNRFERIEYKMPLVRRVGNKTFTWLMSKLTHWPLKDSQPGIFAAARDYLKVFNLPGDYNYTQQILLDGYHQGMRFAHVPVTFRKRTTGRSFISFKYPIKVFPQLMMVIISIKPMKIFSPIGFLFLLIATGIFTTEFVMWLLGQTPKPVLHVNIVLGFSFFGLQTLFFGLLSELIVRGKNR